MPLFTRQQHVNTLAPLRLGELWAVLHNMGKVSGLGEYKMSGLEGHGRGKRTGVRGRGE